MVHACEVANDAEKDISIRRASIFNELFEAALTKEGPPVQPGSEASNTARRSHLAKKQKQKGKEIIDLTQEQAIRDLAQQTEVIDLTVDALFGSQSGRGGLSLDPGVFAGPSQPDPELTREATLPLDILKSTIKDLVIDIIGASKKWTWGVDLTEVDLRGMVRGIVRVDHRHSGYDSSLHTGSICSTISKYMDPATFEDVDDKDLRFDALSSDVGSVRSLEPHEFPVVFALPPLHHLSAFDTNSEPDPVIKAFTKKAMLERGKRQLQEEIYMDSDIYSDEASSSPLRTFHDRLSEPLAPGSDPFYCPVDIASDDSESFEPGDQMDVSMSDDGIQTIPIGNLGEMQAAEDNFVATGPGLPMVIFGSESNSEDNVDTEESVRPMATFVVPQFDAESPTHIPRTVVMCVSDSEEDDDEDEDGHQQSGAVIPAGSGFGRDPVTGAYTAASFAHFQNEWL
jgi:hypothetical protein